MNEKAAVPNFENCDSVILASIGQAAWCVVHGKLSVAEIKQMVQIRRGPDGVDAGSLLPGGQRLDEQLRMAYQQITKNSAMDLKNVMFISHSFQASPFQAKEAYNRFYPTAHNGLTRSQFVHIMREAMSRSGGGEVGGLTDRGRSLHRTLAISDAPLDVSRCPVTLRPRAQLSVPTKLSVATGWGEEATAGNEVSPVAHIADGIRSLESILVLRETQHGTPSRFLQGSVTPRRISTASFVPSQRNLTMAAKRPTTSDGRAVVVRGCGGNNLGTYGRTAFTRDLFPVSPSTMWAARTGGSSAKNPFAPVASTRPRTAAEMGRTVKPKPGTQEIAAEDAEKQAQILLDHIATRLRQLKVQRVDVLRPFEHYDPTSSGQVSPKHAQLALAELDFTLSASAIRAVASVAGALGRNDTVNYNPLVGVISPSTTGKGIVSTESVVKRKVSKRNAISANGIPVDLGNLLEHLSWATLQHRQVCMYVCTCEWVCIYMYKYVQICIRT